MSMEKESGPKLRGTLINRMRSNQNELTETNLEGRTVIQRDSGTEFNIIAVHETTVGSTRQNVANLVSPSGENITLAVADLMTKLKIPGSPWRLKE